MSNKSKIAEFLLQGITNNTQGFQILHFVLFLAIYLAGLGGNIFIIITIALNHRLHTPMYFFLMNLSIVDLGSISVTLPKAMSNSIMNSQSISYGECAAQMFFFLFFMTSDFSLLTVMAYDRYKAICDPLHYESLMDKIACLRMACGVWISGFLNAAFHTAGTFSLNFCSNIIHHLFCEIPQLLELSCSDGYGGETVFIAMSAGLVLGCFVFIITSYVHIFAAVLRVPSVQGRHKAFSTCIPHLIVVSMFVCSGIITYLRSIARSASDLDLVSALLYSVLSPVTNPVIYTMRNKDIKTAFQMLLNGKI
ncbi:olfactory receptor 14A16-like [Sceloporus undulatus]|uniref:olfactory receptor 14A16-like n=1 Tax=Sceloporus undulatus TaxID=8520 RepID=UPI001C4B6D69|nr:olfactory receptor 14A16-like [Sceloporus undulatus]